MSKGVFLELMTNSKPIQYLVLTACILFILITFKQMFFSEEN